MVRIHGRITQKDFHDPSNQYVVITHLEPVILEREVKWALGKSLHVLLENRSMFNSKNAKTYP